MRQVTLFIFIGTLISSCDTTNKLLTYQSRDMPMRIRQSLFNDRASTISEENIQRVFDGSYKLRVIASGYCETGKLIAKGELLVLLE